MVIYLIVFVVVDCVCVLFFVYVIGLVLILVFEENLVFGLVFLGWEKEGVYCGG